MVSTVKSVGGYLNLSSNKKYLRSLLKYNDLNSISLSAKLFISSMISI